MIPGRLAHLPRRPLTTLTSQFLSSRASIIASRLRSRPLQPAPLPTPPAPRKFHSSPTMASAAAAAAAPFLEALDSRRSVYALNKTSPLAHDEIVAILHNVVQHVPSSFNSQSTRLVLLFGAEHDALWDMVLAALQSHLHTDEQREKTKGRISMFKGAYATTLFFEDPAIVEANQAKFPNYAEHFPFWSEHTSGMHQLALWTALEAAGFGANLQHYNPLIDAQVKERWGVPEPWRLRCQLVFGGRVEATMPPRKEKKPVAETVFVHGA